MGRRWKPEANQPSFDKSQSQQDLELEERSRIAERLVRVLQEAGYSCEFGDSGSARTLRRDN